MTFRVSDLMANVMPKEHGKAAGCTAGDPQSCPQCTMQPGNCTECTNCTGCTDCSNESLEETVHCRRHTKHEALAKALSLDLLRTALRQTLAQG